ncbi:hypothetical protein J4205_03640 [Candidatus Pacearchaeota archaeon]|nr:hypothetical protein [Candidatus Pacearchaeota archaeon]
MRSERYNLVKEYHLPNPDISDEELRGIAEEVIQMRFVSYLFQHEAT